MAEILVNTGGYQHHSAEFVGPGHPDRTADGISAAVVQEHIMHDPLARVAAETMLTSTGKVYMSGEITSIKVMSPDDYRELARDYIRGLGWTGGFGYDPDALVIIPDYTEQSSDISQGVVNKGGKVGAGDQGITVGYARRNPWVELERDDFMPLPVSVSRHVLFGINLLRQTTEAGAVLKPDMKSEVIIGYDDRGQPQSVDGLVLALSHIEGVGVEDLRALAAPIVEQVLAKHGLSFDMRKAIINGTGRFVVAGAPGDTGLTGRKLVVDHYGPGVPIGGGAIHGKDDSKADAVGAKLGRWIANQVVQNGLADECFVRITWAIGQPEPLSIVLDFGGTERFSESEIVAMLGKVDWSIAASIDRFGGRRPKQSGIIFPRLAAWGPFGLIDDGSARPWEIAVEPDKWNQWQV